MASTTQGVHLHKLAQLFPAIGNLIRDDDVTEVMVVSHPQRGVLVFFEKKGKLHRARLPTVDKNDVLAFCHAASRPLGSDLNVEPLIDARLADGSRVAIAVPPAAPNGPAVTIRRFAKVAYTGADLVSFGSLPQHVFDLLVHSLTHRGNVLVAGGTGSGKTTLLNALLAEFPEDDRLVVIEDVVELKVDQPNVVRLEARSTGANALKPRVMVKHALRQRPDHIILGEVRGEEAYDVLQALNTGHGGSMTTIHANSAQDALLRLASCAMEGSNDMPWSVVAANVAMAFDLIVYQARRPDRSRGVLEVIRVKGYDRVREEWDVETVWDYESSKTVPAAPGVSAPSVAKPAAPSVSKPAAPPAVAAAASRPAPPSPRKAADRRGGPGSAVSRPTGVGSRPPVARPRLAAAAQPSVAPASPRAAPARPAVGAVAGAQVARRTKSGSPAAAAVGRAPAAPASAVGRACAVAGASVGVAAASPASPAARSRGGQVVDAARHAAAPVAPGGGVNGEAVPRRARDVGLDVRPAPVRARDPSGAL